MSKITGRYDYHDATGKLLYWKERIEPGRNGERKEFIFYHGNREYGRGGASTLYHHPAVIRSRSVIITEGEKQADLLQSWGLCATSLDSGSSGKLNEAIIAALTGKRIAILQDNDEPGTKYALTIAKGLKGLSESMRIVLLPGLPPKGDICDWAGDKAQLLEIIKATPEWIAPPEVKKEPRPRKDIDLKGEITAEMIEIAKQYPIDRLFEFVNGKAPCVMHKEKTGSMTFYKATNTCHCFGCGGNIDAIDAVMLTEGKTFPEAVKYLGAI